MLAAKACADGGRACLGEHGGAGGELGGRHALALLAQVLRQLRPGALEGVGRLLRLCCCLQCASNRVCNALDVRLQDIHVNSS